MKQTEVYKLNLIEGADSFSMKSFNDSAAALEAALVNHDAQIGQRGRIAAGSYKGGTASKAAPTYSDRYGKELPTSFGDPVASGRDIIIEVPFLPRLLTVSAFRSAAFSWSGTLDGEDGGTNDATLSGSEVQAYQLRVGPGGGVAEGRYLQVRPKVYSGAYGGYLAGIAMTSAKHTVPDKNGDGWCELPTLVTISGDADTGYKVTIKAALPTGLGGGGRFNAHDIAELTYNWVAIG